MLCTASERGRYHGRCFCAFRKTCTRRGCAAPPLPLSRAHTTCADRDFYDYGFNSICNSHWAPPVGAPPRVNSSGVVLGRQKALSKTRLPRAVDAPSAHSGRSCRPDNPFPQLPPRRCAGKSTVLRGEPDMESERAMLSSLDFPTESCPFGQRATLGCAHLMPQHMQHACTPPFKCLSPTGGRMNLN